MLMVPLLNQHLLRQLFSLHHYLASLNVAFEEITNEERGETACCAVDGRFANWIPGFELAFGAARPHSARATGYCGAAVDLFLAYPRGFGKIQSLQVCGWKVDSQN